MKMVLQTKGTKKKIDYKEANKKKIKISLERILVRRPNLEIKLNLHNDYSPAAAPKT